MRVLVTGAAGFIGSSVSQRLLERGDAVVGLDNLDPFYDPALKRANLAALAQLPGFAFREGDILDGALLDEVLAPGIDRVVHLAALAGVRPSIAAPERYMRVNVEGTTRVLEACRRHGVRHLVVASSSSVYGARSRTPFSEEDACDRPASPYAASKRATELVCATFHELHGLGVSCLRYFTVFGPRQRPEMAIHAFVRKALAGESIPRFGDGSTGRDYTFIDDIVAGTIAALDRQDGAFRIYNLGRSTPVLLRELIDAVGRATGTAPRIEVLPDQPGDVPITCADTSRAEAELGYRPQVSLDEGLARFVAWIRTPTRAG
ncbi:MAG: GDP-mannose 4,6-dehydratase [Deltaproteobacteria bacterium]|nr:GDP-mannose 4,6-dehydratase [Deltaproteobacteria bacterium]